MALDGSAVSLTLGFVVRPRWGRGYSAVPISLPPFPCHSARISTRSEIGVLFLADNGASPERPQKPDVDPDAESWANVCDTPLRKWKATSHEGGINTPMIAHWPKGIQATGSIYREPRHLIELAGASHPGGSTQSAIPPLEGISLTPSFRGGPLNRNEPLFFEFGSGKAVHHGRWKLVRARDAAWELYDLEMDRTETNDLAAVHPDRVSGLSAAWAIWYKRCTGKDDAKQTD